MMLLSALVFVAATVAMLLRTRAMRIRDRIEAGTFTGLAGEIEGLWSLGVGLDDVEEPKRLAA